MLRACMLILFHMQFAQYSRQMGSKWSEAFEAWHFHTIGHLPRKVSGPSLDCRYRKRAIWCHSKQQAALHFMHMWKCADHYYFSLMLLFVVKYISCFLFSWFAPTMKIFLQRKFLDLQHMPAFTELGFSDAIKQEGGSWVLRCYRYMLPMFISSAQKNYAI